ncbi:SUMO-conjugating enzyme UBC9-A-like [Clytia hemisphaerica]|uniref:SUMO-conjugating enzyme UBC9-A-like n=1 Tax=Clytia hemisphaerica TaxID=252671 RepID=UPI0034D52EFC
MAPNNKVDVKERLKEEHKEWEKSHPKDFKANPGQNNGKINWLQWNCEIPGKLKTPWQGGVYKLCITFTEEYPYQPPLCVFDPPILHPNIYPSGKVSLSLLEKDWVPQITIKQILLGIQILLDDPNFNNPAQAEAFVIHSQGKHLYDEKIKQQAKEMSPSR